MKTVYEIKYTPKKECFVKRFIQKQWIARFLLWHSIQSGFSLFFWTLACANWKDSEILNLEEVKKTLRQQLQSALDDVGDKTTELEKVSCLFDIVSETLCFLLTVAIVCGLQSVVNKNSDNTDFPCTQLPSDILQSSKRCRAEYNRKQAYDVWESERAVNIWKLILNYQ